MARGNPTLTVEIDADTKGLDKGLAGAEAKVGGFGGKLAPIAAKAAKVAVPVAAVAAATVKLGAAADKTETDIAAFDIAMKNLGVSAGKSDENILAASAAAKELAFTGGETRDALTSLVTATKDTAKAEELLAVSMDVARFAGVDLTTAADAVSKAYVGNDRALRALVPGLEAGATGMETITNAQNVAAGSAENFSTSMEGLKIKGVSALKGLANAIGQLVLPILEVLGPALVGIITSFTTLIKSILPVVTPLIKAVADAVAFAANMVAKLLDMISKLIGKLRELMKPLNDAIAKLKEIDLNPFKQATNIINSQQTTAQVGTRGTTASAFTGGGAGGVTINIYGDPSVIEARVTKALRDYARRNGASAVFTPERA